MTKIVLVASEFCAAHLYKQNRWSDAENKAHFGKCYSDYGHGHNYRLEVGFKNSQTPAFELKMKVKEATELLDHQHLNFMVPELADKIPTTENIAIFLLKKLHELCPIENLSHIRLSEAKDLWVEIRP